MMEHFAKLFVGSGIENSLFYLYRPLRETIQDIKYISMPDSDLAKLNRPLMADDLLLFETSDNQNRYTRQMPMKRAP